MAILLKNKALRFFALSLLSLCLALFFSYHNVNIPRSEKFASELEKKIQRKETELQNLLHTFPTRTDSCHNASLLLNKTKGLFEKKGLLFLLYQKDSLIFWSENTAPFSIQKDSTELCSPILELDNGWYLIKTQNMGEYSWVGLYLIYSRYPYENDYLINGFNKDLGLPSSFEISKQSPGTEVKTHTGEIMFYLRPAAHKHVSDLNSFILLFFYLCSYFFFWLFLYSITARYRTTRNASLRFTGLFAFLFVLIRGIIFYFHLPPDLYATPLFGPISYASSALLPSLGDLLINAFCFLFLAFIIFRNISQLSGFLPGKIQFTASLIIHMIILYLLGNYIQLYHGLILNSNIPLDLSNPEAFNISTVYALCVTACTYLGLLLISICGVYAVKPEPGRSFKNLLPPALSLIFFSVYLYSIKADLILNILLAIFSLAIIHLYLSKIRFFRQLPAIFLYSLLFTFFSSFILVKALNERENAHRRLLAQKLSVERDPIAEYLVQEQYKQMIKDEVLKKDLISAVFNDYREEMAFEFCRVKYFSEYWSKYNLTFTLCHPGRMLNVVVPNNAVVDCDSFFKETIKMGGKPTSTNLMYYFDYGTESINYLAALPFSLSAGDIKINVTVYIDIISKSIPKGLGYPELLMGKNTGFSLDINQYSYAIYQRHSLLRSNGKFSYNLSEQFTGPTTERFSEYERGGFNHLSYQVDKDKTIVISQKNKSWREVLAPISYLLFFYSLFLLLTLAMAGYLYIPRIAQMNFSNRLQLYMITLILSAFLITGYVTFRYINSLYATKNAQNLREKTYSVLNELQQKLSANGPINANISNDLYFLLNKFSLIFFTDINLYDLNGNLMASSRPQIFEEGLLSTKIDNPAFYELRNNKKSIIIQQEKIGKYGFLSAYMPLRNGQDELIGYLNLPYFAKQGEIRNEISTFFVAFLNIYLILIILAVVLALFMATYITRPLRVMREKMSRVKLGKSNEKLSWNRKDEIGLLVGEYNHMIDKLAQSAEQLARSERESAWREMARQVAHEIKNPLTPMKLSVQLLQRAWNEKETNWDQRLERFTKTLVEQIDTLSAIASEFSDFAQMPVSQHEAVNLEDILQSAIDLYSHPELFETKLIGTSDGTYPVMADKKQLNRVFSNLFRNSIQAFPSNHKGSITISIRKEQAMIILDFTDNGMGIPHEQQRSIFTPNFTTKSGGMGLGLAMVKNIMQECGGDITFRSVEGDGTTFTLLFPSARTV